MTKENGVTPKQEVAKALKKMAGPWIAIRQLPPAFSVKEVSRTTGLSPTRVTESILERGGVIFSAGGSQYSVVLENLRGEQVNGNIDLAAKMSASSIRAIRESRYKSRAPGGGPVIKARILDRNLDRTKVRLGRERLKVKMEPLQESPEEKRRREIKERQAIRVMNRFGVNRTVAFREKDTRAMEFLSSIEYSSPVRADEIEARIRNSRENGTPLTLFVPWGVRPIGKLRLELEVMSRLQTIRNQLQEMGISAQILIMSADIYATEINSQVDINSARNYFRLVEKMAVERGFDFIAWSQIRQENMERYQQMAKTLSDDEIRKTVDAETIQSAFRSSARRSGNFTRRGIEQAAFAYMRERMIEGQLIDSIYQPIKVSIVAKYKDSLDGPLPRVYIIPQEEQFPWLK